MLLAALLSTAVAAAPAAPPKPFTTVASVEGVTQYALPNGLQVLFIPDPSKPSVTVNLTVFVGSRHEGYGEKGMAHLFEHMLFKKTKKFASIKDELTRLGGDANGTTWYDRTNYFESFPADDARVRRAIELEAQRLRSAIISKDELATEMTVVRNELEMGENRPSSVMRDRVASMAYVWHSYGNSPIGPRSDIENVPNARLVAWYETYYQPDNAMLVVAGRFDQAKAFKTIADTFGRMAKPKRVLPTTYTVEPPQDGERQVTVRRVGGNPLLMVGYHVPAGTDPDYAAIDVLERVLGDAPSGRLYEALVKTHKAARVGCGGYQLKEPGLLLCFAELGPKDSVEAARKLLVATVEGVGKAPVTAEELARAKQALAKDFHEVLAASDQIALQLSEFAAMGDWRMFFLARDRDEAIGADEVTAAAGRYLISSNRTLGEYVPTEKPARAEVPPVADLAPLLKDYQGRGAAPEGEAFDTSPANIEARTTRTALSGGLKVALLPKKTRGGAVSAVIELRWGDEKSLTGKHMVSIFAARMLLRGTTQHTRQQVTDELAQLKTEVDVQAGTQGITVRVSTWREHLPRALELVFECLRSPAFDAKELEALRREVLADAERRKDDPSTVGMVAIQRMLNPFPAGHPLAVLDAPETIAAATAVTLDEVKALYAGFYGAQQGEVAVVGDFDPAAVKSQLEGALGAWKSRAAYARVTAAYKDLPAQEKTILTPDKAMAIFAAGRLFRMRDDSPDYPAMLMADYMLGGGFLNGRIPQRLREQEGLSYGAGSWVSISSDDEHSTLIAYAIYAPENVDKIEKAFGEEMARAERDGFTEKELTLAREGLLKSREQERSDDLTLASALAGQLEFGRTMAFEQGVEHGLQGLSAADVGATLRRYVDLGRLSVVKAGDFKKAKK